MAHQSNNPRPDSAKIKALYKEINHINDMLKSYKAASVRNGAHHGPGTSTNQFSNFNCSSSSYTHNSNHFQNKFRTYNNYRPTNNRGKFAFIKNDRRVPQQVCLTQNSGLSATTISVPKYSISNAVPLSSSSQDLNSLVNKAKRTVLCMPSTSNWNLSPKPVCDNVPLLSTEIDGTKSCKPMSEEIELKRRVVIPAVCESNVVTDSVKIAVSVQNTGIDKNIRTVHLQTPSSTPCAFNFRKELTDSQDYILSETSKIKMSNNDRRAKLSFASLKPGSAKRTVIDTKFKYVSKDVKSSNAVMKQPEYVHSYTNPKMDMCLSKRLLLSKYKVVNKNASLNNNAPCVQVKRELSDSVAIPNNSVSHRSVETKKVINSSPPMKQVVKTAYKIVNRKKSFSKSGLKSLNLTLKTPEARRLLLQQAKSLSEAAGKNKTPQLCTVIKNLCVKSQQGVMDSKPNTPSKSKLLFAKFTSSKTTSPECLKKKLLTMKASNSIDLTDVSPEELVALDHRSLLKLSAMVKPSDSKPFVKRTKYKIVSNQKSSGIKNKKVKKASWTLRQHLSMKNTPRQFAGLGNKHFNKNQHILSSRKSQTFRNSSFLKVNKRYQKTVQIGEITYKKSSAKMLNSKENVPNKEKSTVIVVRGVRFQMDPSGKSLKKLSDKQSGDIPLKRIDLGGRTYIGTAPDTFTATPSKVRNLASRVLHRSIQTAVAATAKKALRESTYCMFYNRFGKCNRQSDCPYIHDPSKIAVCTRFLRGTCKVDNCPFSHERNPGKMAICSFFLQGSCSVTDCPYRHEMIKPDAELCQDFVRGYCASGNECEKAHILICPRYFQGKCTEGESCKYPHPPRKEKRKTEDVKDLKPQVVAKPESEEEEEKRYFNSNSDKEEVVGEGACAFVRQGCSWVGQEAPALPQYIPLTFDDADCLMK